MPSLLIKKVDADWMQKVRVAAAVRGVSMKWLVLEAVSFYLNTKPAPKPAKHADARG